MRGAVAISRRMPASRGGASMIRWKLQLGGGIAVVGLSLAGFYLNPVSASIAQPPHAAIHTHPSQHTSTDDVAFHSGGPVHPKTGVGSWTLIGFNPQHYTHRA